ncbi:sensor histidine kinase [Inmirania thermothiophila]|uniref:histidine kinase n=1 Tax=Inmirania thermothiophila TaxID=1750597 RepID=A0A3N1Y613_9GAMM|nr:ATP-binding protein [Inmirania thermothiophila]ROR34249.1 nitrogen fixation/metabolism regulation signal transduction histidine kinase [Inmirania thermothiophila]
MAARVLRLARVLARRGPARSWAAAAALAAALLLALHLMGQATENSVRFGRLYSLLLVVNAGALFLLAGLVVASAARLLRQYRAGVVGSRLTARLVLVFVLLTLAPVAVVYSFSIQFLHRGIDSWFDVRIEEALRDALELSRSSLDLYVREQLRQTRVAAAGIPAAARREELALAVAEVREALGASELTVLAGDGTILATSSTDPTAIVPSRPPEEVLLQVRSGRVYASLDPVTEGDLYVRIVLPLAAAGETGRDRLVQALFPVPTRIDDLAASVQEAFTRYRELAYLRRPLRLSFTLTLSLVLAVSVLAAMAAAFYSARRLVRPIRDLAEGTRAVAAGHYDRQLPRTSRDELGFLVQSFNIMTRRIAQASEQARRSRAELERQKAYLEAVLGHLSSGVLVLDEGGGIRTVNQAAAQLLGIPLRRLHRVGLAVLAAGEPRIAPLARLVEAHVAADDEEWRGECELVAGGSRQILVVSGTRLPPAAGAPGQVVVLEDVTALVQAQREAAWGEVARRLAHEIKNPLTPIQLSAERLCHKYARRLPPEEAAALERYTQTIIQQVRVMKDMVDAFSAYARAPDLALAPVEIDRLVREVCDLYRGERRIATLEVVTGGLPPVAADAARLRQVLHNLLTNAAEALEGRADGRVRVETRLVEEGGRSWAELAVCDNGPGLPQGLADRLFEPYVTTKKGGTGLGLAIVRRIVEEHGGKIRAEGAPGGGACIRIRLPAEGGAAGAVRQQA